MTNQMLVCLLLAAVVSLSALPPIATAHASLRMSVPELIRRTIAIMPPQNDILAGYKELMTCNTMPSNKIINFLSLHGIDFYTLTAASKTSGVYALIARQMMDALLKVSVIENEDTLSFIEKEINLIFSAVSDDKEKQLEKEREKEKKEKEKEEREREDKEREDKEREEKEEKEKEEKEKEEKEKKEREKKETPKAPETARMSEAVAKAVSIKEMASMTPLSEAKTISGSSGDLLSDNVEKSIDEAITKFRFFVSTSPFAPTVVLEGYKNLIGLKEMEAAKLLQFLSENNINYQTLQSVTPTHSNVGSVVSQDLISKLRDFMVINPDVYAFLQQTLNKLMRSAREIRGRSQIPAQ